MKKLLSLLLLLFINQFAHSMEEYSGIPELKQRLNELIQKNVDANWPEYIFIMQNLVYSDKYFEELKLMLEIGVNPNQFGCSAFFDACSNGALKNAALLLKYKVDPNWISPMRDTPLIASVQNCRKDIFNLLLNCKVNLDYQDRLGNTALIHACTKSCWDRIIESNRSHLFAHLPKNATTEERQEELKKIRRFFVRSLLKAGARIDIKSSDKKTALDIAQDNGFEDIVKLLKNFNSEAAKLKRIIKAHLNKYTEQDLRNLPKETLALLPTCNTCNLLPTIEHTLKICGQCKKTYYCSRKCQKKDWNSHKLICKNKAH